ncbi:hypothetical protein RB7178 [Rhodopirellula baltica SH 1]|uniref:Uncharacterized protein n=1 Tax=Rhodopirellula baltica (strain DSM 10527 / NCIMB 13988 / SH1) TaxID=243090 RepID=Q7UP42_RHOBA|nr:hypothetical protein RB7178 [Rhodopirellula baltica SH 1]
MSRKGAVWLRLKRSRTPRGEFWEKVLRCLTAAGRVRHDDGSRSHR